jgi:hypothetical protein
MPVVAAALVTLLVAAAAAGCGDGGGDDEGVAAPTQHFVSRPDLQPVVVDVDTAKPGRGAGYVFLAPKRGVVQTGPMILDSSGRLVWFRPLDTQGVTDFRAQTYGGRPVLTWWRGKAVDGVGDGYYVIADDSYDEIATVRGGRGLPADVHELLITPRDTALITVYERKAYDLSPVGGPAEGSIWDGVVQEIDIATGKVLFEWRSSEHVALSESYAKAPPAAQGAKAAPYDYFHVNSIDLEPDGNLLVSARNTQTVYEIDRKAGEVIWRLGGKKSDFAMGPGTAFAWQHDARRQPDGTITLFDNAADPAVEPQTRVLRLDVDAAAKQATLVRSYTHPRKLLAGSQGNAQFLADGNVFVGWGAQPTFSELTRDGEVLLDAHFGGGDGSSAVTTADGRTSNAASLDSYRAYFLPWTGRPGGKPAIAVRGGDGGSLDVYASWNGATLVRRWQVLAGPTPTQLDLVTTVPRTGFETRATVTTDEAYVAMRALDAGGTILGTSNAVAVDAGGG